jgi:Transposase DDE domain
MPTLVPQEAPLYPSNSWAMSHLLPARREFASPAHLHRLLLPLPLALLKQVAADFQFDKWARTITFLPYFRMHLLLALTRYQTLSELQVALREDPLFALAGARLSVSVSALAQLPDRRGSGAFHALLSHVLAKLADLPHPTRRGRTLTTATRQSIQELLLTTQIVDSSTFALPPAVAAWAKSREDAAGFKLHLRLAAGYGGLAQIDFSPAREHDRPHRELLIEHAQAGDLFLLDRGYQDYTWFDRFTEQGICFVSKLKRGHACAMISQETLEDRVTPSGYTLQSQRRVRLGGEQNRTAHEYRLLDVLTPDGKEATLVTNRWDLTPEQFCGLYQYRWTIEIVFRWLKHTLGLSHLVSTNREGVRIQILMALLVYALLVIYQEGNERLSPKYLVLRAQHMLHWALIECGYALAVAEIGASPPLPD